MVGNVWEWVYDDWSSDHRFTSLVPLALPFVFTGFKVNVCGVGVKFLLTKGKKLVVRKCKRVDPFCATARTVTGTGQVQGLLPLPLIFVVFPYFCCFESFTDSTLGHLGFRCAQSVASSE